MTLFLLTSAATVLRILCASSLTQTTFANEVAVMQNLKKAYPDWEPRGIVDVGANKGGWTRNAHKIFPNVPTYMIEASPEHTESLTKVKNDLAPNINFEITVMTDKDGDHVDFFGGGGTGDSMFKENTKFYKDSKSVSRETKKLDSIVKDMEHIDYLKLDVQGAEILVLSGASETLKRVTFVQLEVSTIDYNDGGACWFDVDAKLREFGFYLYDTGDYRYAHGLFRTKGIGQLDTLYVKTASPYLPKWLVEQKPSFCGANRDVTPQNVKENHVEDATAQKNAAEVLVLNSNEPGVQIVGYFVTLLVGFMMGKLMSSFSSKKRRRI